jgi:phosphoribosylglycinamide formyltransferase-1
MKNIVVLFSGRGSNMIAIARACSEQGWPARIAAVISSRPDAAGLSAAARLGLRTEVLDSREHPDRVEFDALLAARIDAYEPAIVVLAGFMRVLGDAFVDRYAGRLVNIHPSLLPSFPGLHTHRKALEAGVKIHGATVHLVTRELDAGPIVAQVAVPVLAGDDEAALAARVLEAEHQLYPTALRWLVEDRVQVRGRAVWLRNPDDGPQALDGLGPANSGVSA